MKKYIWIIVCLIWIFLVGHKAYTSMWHIENDSTYTTENGDAYDSQSDMVYVTDNVDTTGFVYRIDPNNQVKAMFRADSFAKATFCDELLYKEGQLYVLLYGTTTVDTKPVRAYCIVQLDADTLKPAAHSNWFCTYEAGNSQSLTKDDTFFYLTELSMDDTEARVYAVPLEAMGEVTSKKERNIRNVSTIRYSAAMEPSDGYYFVYASYNNGQLTTMENGNGLIDDSIYNANAAKRFANKQFTLGQLISINQDLVKLYGVILLVGVLFLGALYFFVRQRNRVAYLIVLWEAMLAIVFLFSLNKLSEWNTSNNWNEVLRFVAYTVDDVRTDLDQVEEAFQNTENYYRTDSYRNITDRLKDVVKNYGNGDVFANLLSISLLEDGEYHVVAAAKGVSNCNLEQLYGNVAISLAETVNASGGRGTAATYIDGVKYSLICVGEKGKTNPTSLLMAVIHQNGSEEYGVSQPVMAILISILLFIFSSIAGVIILSRQAKDLQFLGNTMTDISQGGGEITKPETLGEDMSDMWSGLMDIDRNMKNLNYIKYRSYEIYCKFAPKAVERLLDKSSITEVVSGDTVKKQGTVALIDSNTNSVLCNLAKEQSALEDVNIAEKSKEVLQLLSQYQENNLAYKISVSSDMSEIDLLIPKTVNKACEIGMELNRVYEKTGNDVCIFMHYTDYLYGVTMAGEEAVQYLVSTEMMQIKEKLPLLNTLKLGMVVTGSVLERELEKPENRYIGYWNLGDENKLDLYEVLDTCSNEDRHKREMTAELFAEGLELFYENNYYLARNNFAKVIRIDQSDSVARWYLFTCERYLDGTLHTKNYELSE